MGYLLNGVKTGGIPMDIIFPIINFVKVEYLIETGTASGDSIKTAAPYFKHAHTVEIVPNRQVIDETIENITWHEGNSATVLPKIVDEILAERLRRGLTDDDYLYSLFWLDSHYSGDTESPAGTKECPILDEIVSISPLKTDAILIIDDARLFLSPPPYPLDTKQWPRIDTIILKIKELFPHYMVTLRDDYIIAYPSRLSEPIDKEWRDNFSKRYPNAKDKLKTEVKNSWNAFKNYLENK